MVRWLAQEEVDIRALPELSDEDLIYLGVSNTSQRRKLLQVARALKRSAAQRLRGTQATDPACQPAQVPAGSTAAQCAASATSVSRSGSHDSRKSPQGSHDKAVAAAAAPLASDVSSCKVVQQRSHTGGKDKAGTAGLLLAIQASTESQNTPGVAASKRSAGSELPVLPQSKDDADFAEPPEKHTRPPLKKFAKLSRSMVSRRKTDRPITKSHGLNTAAAAAKDHVTAGSSLRDAPSKEQSAMLRGTGKAPSLPSSVTAAQNHMSTGMGAEAAASQEHTSLAAHVHRVPGTGAVGSLPPLKPCYSSHPPLTAEEPARLEAQPVAGGPKQGTEPGGLANGGRPSSAKDESRLHGDEKPAAYLSGALGYLLATR